MSIINTRVISPGNLIPVCVYTIRKTNQMQRSIFIIKEMDIYVPKKEQKKIHPKTHICEPEKERPTNCFPFFFFCQKKKKKEQNSGPLFLCISHPDETLLDFLSPRSCIMCMCKSGITYREAVRKKKEKKMLSSNGFIYIH